MMTDRLPPHSQESEQIVIGTTILAPDQMPVDLQPHHFYSTWHQTIWASILSLEKANKTVDYPSVVEQLRCDNMLERANGAGYVAELTGHAHAGNLEHLSKIIRDHAQRRAFLRAVTEARDGVYAHGSDVDELVNEIEKSIQVEETSGVVYTAAQAAGEFFDDVQEIYKGNKEVVLNTGFGKLEQRAPLARTDLVVVGGRPGMGKTAFALNWGLAAARAGNTVLMFSLEMSRKQLMARLTSLISGVDSSKFRQANFTESEMAKIVQAAGLLSQLPIHINDEPRLSSLQIKRITTRFMRKHGKLDLAIVDYVQRMKEPGDWTGNKRLEVGESVINLKGMAKEMDIGVMALCQLNRSSTQGGVRRPAMSDLKESGDIEQEADSVILIHRPEYYDKAGTKPEEIGLAEIIVEKNRHGLIGLTEMNFDGPTMRFTDERDHWGC